jgi:sulfatase maturation enzyme AslB (radical SAM superfamily)
MKKICGVPFYEISLYQNSKDKGKIEALPCCKSWLKEPYSKDEYIFVKEDIHSNIDLMGVWNSYQFISFRESIIDGTYEYCNLDTCPNYKSNNLQILPEESIPFINKNIFKLDYPPILTRVCSDRFCNLACPSCRSHRTLFALPKSKDRLKSIMRSGTKRIFINGGGEFFANKYMLEAISDFSYEKYPHIEYFDLITNGTLLTKAMWMFLPKDFRDKIINIVISLDSCNKEVYQKIRRGADFQKTMNNIRFISNLKKSGELPRFGLSFVIQKSNIEELPNFIKFADEIGADVVILNKAEKWNYFGMNYFEQKIKLPDNWENLYKDIIEETKNIILKKGISISTNILNIK